MTLKLVSTNTSPNYIALSTDVTSGCPLEGALLIGKTIYCTDNGSCFIIDADLNLQAFKSAPLFKPTFPPV